MKNLLERFLEYVKIDTQSDENTGTHPSTEKQAVFARKLAEELRNIPLRNVRVTEHACVYGELPATPGLESVPALGFIAHLDTSNAASGTGVKPNPVSYSGGEIPLGNSGKTLNPGSKFAGQLLVTTDGTTLLGADDKAGIAEIITAFEQIQTENIPHGKLCAAFTPDEEIGEGTLFFDLAGFGAKYAFTMDGDAAGGIEYQNFNAAEATFHVHGVSVHPGSAKGIMKNALRIALEADSLLPRSESPEQTEGFEGFYHPVHISGTVGNAELIYLIRDHHAEHFEKRKEKLRKIAAALNRKYGKKTVELTIRDQYRNMEEIIEKNRFLLDLACEAVTRAGLSPQIKPIRGGTDGAMLSFRGLPCPNLGTGGYNYHGEWEFASVPEMEQSVRIIKNLAEGFAAYEKSR